MIMIMETKEERLAYSWVVNVLNDYVDMCENCDSIHFTEKEREYFDLFMNSYFYTKRGISN